MERVLKKAFYDPVHPGSYGGVAKLYKALKAEGQTIREDEVRRFLSGQDAYTLHKPARVHFLRNRVFVTGPLRQFQADLCDMKALAEHNDDHHYLLTVIDVFSKKAFVRCLKRKTATEVVRAFESVFKESRVPLKLQTDAGKEFLNKTFQTLMAKHEITHFTTASDLKASVVERFNRTLKTRMWKYFTANNTLRYRDVLQDLVKGYNNSYHSSIKMKPAEVNDENTSQVFQNLFGAKQIRRCRYRFKVGDSVRISKIRGVFDKRYEQTFTDEIFTIDERVPRYPPVYKLRDFDGEVIQGSFYEEELQKVDVPPGKLYRVEKILKKRTVRGKKQILVKWRNWPDKFNSWVSADAVCDIERPL